MFWRPTHHFQPPSQIDSTPAGTFTAHPAFAPSLVAPSTTSKQQVLSSADVKSPLMMGNSSSCWEKFPPGHLGHIRTQFPSALIFLNARVAMCVPCAPMASDYPFLQSPRAITMLLLGPQHHGWGRNTELSTVKFLVGLRAMQMAQNTVTCIFRLK